MCGVPNLSERALMMFDQFNAEKCQGVQLLPQRSFYPIGVFESPLLYKAIKSDTEWRDFFKDSYTVHMYYSSKSSSRLILRPKYYGEKIPGYLHLALNYCSTSYYSEKTFWKNDNLRYYYLRFYATAVIGR